MKRYFFTVGRKKCPFGCTYCFTEFNNYIRPPSIYSLLDGSILIDDIDIIYPACDIDFFALKNWREILQSLVKYKKTIVISTKATLTNDDVSFIFKIYQQLLSCGGFLKIGISITTKFSVENIEPKTPSYDNRLSSAKRLYYTGVPICLIMKPLLVEIGDGELNSIIDDFHSISNILLTGDEYLDSESPRAIEYIDSENVIIESKLVNWKEDKAEWNARKNTLQINKLLTIANKYNLATASTDVEAVVYLREKYGVASD